MESRERWMDRVFVRWLPALVWAGFIFYLSSLPQRDIPQMLFPHQDKVMHLGLYGFFGFFLAHGMRLRRFEEFSDETWRRLAMALALGVLYGMSDEFHQKFVEGRGSSLMDLLFDSIGVVLGGLFLVYGSRFDQR